MVLTIEATEDRSKRKGFLLNILPLVFLIISYMIFRLGDLFHTNATSAFYMLSTLIQIEGTILAIVITLSLVAVQLTVSSYSSETVRIFRRFRSLWIIMGLYISAILYTLLVVKMIESGPGQYPVLHFGVYRLLDISFCYFIGVVCLTALIPYAYGMLKMLEPVNLIRKLSLEITKENILKPDYGELSPIKSIMDIVRSSIIRHDYETTRDGLREIRNRICLLFQKEELSAEQETKISELIFSYFSRIAEFGTSEGNLDSATEVILNIEEIGEIAIERKLKKATEETIKALVEIGKVAIRRRMEEVVSKVISSLEEITYLAKEKKLNETEKAAILALKRVGLDAMERRLEESSWVAVFSLGEIVTKAIWMDAQTLACHAVCAIEEIAIASEQRNLRNVLETAVSILERVGLDAVGKEFEKVSKAIARTLAKIEINALEEDRCEFVWDSILLALKKIGVTSLEKKLHETTVEVISAFGEIGIIGLEKGYEFIWISILLTLREIGMNSSSEALKAIANKILIVLKEIGEKVIEKNLEEESKEIVNLILNIGLRTVESESRSILSDSISSLEFLGIVAIEKYFKKAATHVLSCLQGAEVILMNGGYPVEALSVASAIKVIGIASKDSGFDELKKKAVMYLKETIDIAKKKKNPNLPREIANFVQEIELFRGNSDYVMS